MNPASEDRQLGEYQLKQLLGESPLSLTWLARQISVSRLVLVDELRADQRHQQEAFLADARAKAAVDHPLIGSVYEAVAEPEHCFYAHELLPGITLADRLQGGEAYAPARLAHLLRRVAEAHLQHELLGQSTSPLGLESIHQDEHGVVRLGNLAIAGPRTPDQSVRDIVHLGEALPALISAGQPGATRMLTLLGWMRGEGLDAPINWAQVRDFCLQIEHQLADPLSIVPTSKGGSRSTKKSPIVFIAPLTALFLIGVIVIAVKMRPPTPSAPPRASLPAPVAVAAGKHETPDGSEESLPAFRISAHEITIGQYAEFLETLAVLAKEQRQNTFDSSSQPADKVSHDPTEWPALLAAAKSNGVWKDFPVTLDSPVVGVDWWDAAAYAEWKKARLPTQEEWFAALKVDVKKPAGLPAGPWISVTDPTPDRTTTGLTGMAGSVCEWTAKPAPNPANPLGEKLWVIIGGSHLKAGTNALTREWTADRSLRRPDLGFRVVFDAD
jgi:hypothetical protein